MLIDLGQNLIEESSLLTRFTKSQNSHPEPPPAAPTTMPLPDTAITIHGGCNCRAIRYEVNIPLASDRPWHPYSDEEVHLPFLALYHCDDCRRATGALFLAGACMPVQFVRPSLLPRSPPAQTELPDVERHWVPATAIFQPGGTFSYSRYPMPPG